MNQEDLYQLGHDLEGLAVSHPNEMTKWLSAASLVRNIAREMEQLKADVATLSQEHTCMRARNERLEKELNENR
jgi:hypothetical protein